MLNNCTGARPGPQWQGSCAHGTSILVPVPPWALRHTHIHCLTQGGHSCFPFHLDWEVDVLTSPLHYGSSACLAFVQALQSPCREMTVLIDGKLAFLNKVLFLQKGRASQWKHKNMDRSNTCITYMLWSQYPLRVWIKTMMFTIFF